jgi:hypothetical protein
MIISGYSSTPRSGSTLLNALLNQRPDVYMPFASPLLELLWRNYQLWNDPRYKNVLDWMYNNGDGVPVEIKNARNNYCLEIVNIFFKQSTDKKYVIDKNCSWINIENRNMYEDLYNKKIPIIYIHRNYDDIVKSYKRIIPSIHVGKYIECAKTIYNNQCYYLENNPDNIVYIEYNDWCNKTEEMLKYIEVELGLESYSYDFKNPRIDTQHIDKMLGNDKLHVLRDASVYKKRY